MKQTDTAQSLGVNRSMIMRYYS